MAKSIVKSGFLELDSVDQSAKVTSVNITIDANVIDIPTYVDVWMDRGVGLNSANLSIEIIHDTDDTIGNFLFSRLGTSITFKWRRSSAAIGASNPEYSGTVIVASFGMGGNVGDAETATIELPVDGQITRATA